MFLKLSSLNPGRRREWPLKTSSSSSITDEQYKEITKRLDALIRLTALGLPESVSEDRKVKVLSELGLPPVEIAPMVGSNRKAVALRLLRMRAREKQSPKPSQEESAIKDANTDETAEPIEPTGT